MNFEFTLNYQLSPGDDNLDELVERLGEADCTDNAIGVGQAGRIELLFAREEEDAYAAMTSALADIKRLIPSAKLIEVGPDLVGLTEIAGIVGFSRQYMRKLVIKNCTTIPAPVHEGSTVLWHLVDMLRWLGHKGDYECPPGTFEVAELAKQLNLISRSQGITLKATNEIRGLLS
jgi:hypothetical protein